jgi:hypothetical protein
MSWNTVEKSQVGSVTYIYSKYSGSITSGISNSFNALGFNQGSISFTNNRPGNMTVTVYGSIDGTNFFTLKSKENPEVSGDAISWSKPVRYIKIGCSSDTIGDIALLTET